MNCSDMSAFVPELKLNIVLTASERWGANNLKLVESKWIFLISGNCN